MAALSQPWDKLVVFLSLLSFDSLYFNSSVRTPLGGHLPRRIQLVRQNFPDPRRYLVAKSCGAHMWLADGDVVPRFEAETVERSLSQGLDPLYLCLTSFRAWQVQR